MSFYVARETFAGLGETHRGMLSRVNVEVSPGVVLPKLVLVVSLDNQQSLAIELSTYCSHSPAPLTLMEAIYGDVRVGSH